MAAPVPETYQELIARLQGFWMEQGCVILQPYHTEVGAGTFNPATFLRALGPRPWRTAYVEPSIRPTDGRYGENPFRLQHYFQYQVLLKPSPEDVVDVYFASLEAIGIDPDQHDLRSSRTTGRARPWAPGAPAGRCGSTAWRSPSSPTSSRPAASTSRRSRWS